MFKKKEFFINIFNEFKKKQKMPLIDMHTHTSWTDGKNSVSEMAFAAVKKNMKSILFSEHSRADSGIWFLDFVKEVEQVKKKFEGECIFLIGTEVKILNDKGDLDLSSKIKKECDLIMGSVHRFPGEAGTINNTKGKFTNEEAILLEYELASAAIENPDVDIIGHPFGMSLKRFKANPPWELFLRLIKKANSFEKIFEINFHYHNNYKQLIDACLKNNTLISFGSNAHSINELGKISEIKF
tara:strand:+ start:527 stop:1249 length:723 start_codon:yes stop_codon:yes gene_type:complete